MSSSATPTEISSTSSTGKNPSPDRPQSLFARVFKAFSYRDFRVMWIGACTSSIGTWMQQLAQAWLVLQLSGSAFLLGLDSFLGQIPIFLFSLIGGVIADRVERRNLLLMSQVIQMTTAFILTVVFVMYPVRSAPLGAVTHVDWRVWPILVMSFVVGLAQSFGGPAYSALIPTLVKPQDLSNAIALNSIQFNLARVIGPAIGGLTLATLGAAWCFGLNSLSFVAVIISLLIVRTRFIPKKTTESILESMKGGIAFVRQRSGMDALIVLAFGMTLLAIPLLVFLPVFARDVLGGTAKTFTALLGCSGGGSITGALLVAWLGKPKRQGLIALLTLIGLGGAISAFALSKSVILSSVLVFMCGVGLMVVFALISSLVQLITTDDMRGRVMSVYNVAFRGGMPIGSLVVGALIKHYTAPVVLAGNGVLLALLGVYFLTVNRRIAEL